MFTLNITLLIISQKTWISKEMVYCHICKKAITDTNMKNAFRIILGNIINGRFQGEKTYHYHQECLINDENLERNEISQIE